MKLDKIHHVAIIASDYEVSKDFYVNKLGFEILRENYRAERDDYKLDLKLGDCEIELFGIKTAPKRPNYPEACGLRHLAFHVECIEDVIEELNIMGIETERESWATPLAVVPCSETSVSIFFSEQPLFLA